GGISAPGHTGGHPARLFSAAGHDVLVSFSTDQAKLAELAADAGAAAGTPAQAASHGEVVVLSVPWGVVGDALAQAGGPGALAGRTVIDTTNQFGNVGGRFGVLDLGGGAAPARHAAEGPGPARGEGVHTPTARGPASSAPR